MTSKQGIIIAAFVAALAALGGSVWYFFLRDTDSAPAPDSAAATASAASTAPASHGPLPVPVVVVIDKAGLLRGSKAGQDITNQIRVFTDQARTELDPQGRALQAEATSLKSRAAGMTPEQRQAAVTAFENKQAAFQRAAGLKQNQIQMALASANRDMEKAVGPVLKQVMAAHHANIVFDKQVVILSTDNNFDITAEVVQKLDGVLSSVKVTLPPEGMVPQGGATP